MKNTWYLFRHALATYSTAGYGDKILTAEILPNETEPIKKMADFFTTIKKSVNYSSELTRCIQTTDIISERTGKTFTTDVRLNEYYKESFRKFTERVIRFVDEIASKSTSDLLICSHGAVIACIKYYALTHKVTENNLLDYPACGELVILRDTLCTVQNYNT